MADSHNNHQSEPVAELEHSTIHQHQPDDDHHHGDEAHDTHDTHEQQEHQHSLAPTDPTHDTQHAPPDDAHQHQPDAPSTAPSSSTANPNDIPSFCVISYNVRKVLSRTGKGTSRPLKVIEAIRSSGADVVCLQETHQAWEQLLRTSLGTVYPHMSFHHHASSGGLACLSRWPILSETIIDTPGHVSGSAFPLWLGSIAVELDDRKTRIEVWFANVHLRPPLLSRAGYVSVKAYFATPAIRLAELRFLVAHLIRALSRRRSRVTDILEQLPNDEAAATAATAATLTQAARANGPEGVSTTDATPAGDFEFTAEDASAAKAAADAALAAAAAAAAASSTTSAASSLAASLSPSFFRRGTLATSGDTALSSTSTSASSSTGGSPTGTPPRADEATVPTITTTTAAPSSPQQSATVPSLTPADGVHDVPDVDVPIIVLGDFSEDETGMGLRWLSGSPDTGKPCDRCALPLANTLAGLDITSVTYEWAVALGVSLYGRFDHIYYSIHTLHCIGSWVVPECDVRWSDHFPLIAHFSLVDRGASSTAIVSNATTPQPEERATATATTTATEHDTMQQEHQPTSSS